VSLGTLIGELDRDRFRATVYCPDGPSAELFRDHGAEVITGPVASFTHIWASYYSGLRWLLFTRELARLPAFMRRLSEVIRDGEFDLVHLNDSPLVYAALAAHRRSLPVIWHVRSSLARGGADRRSRLICRLIDHTASAVIAIDSDVARSMNLRTPITIVHNSVDLVRFAPAPGDEAKRRLQLREDSVSIGLFGYLYARKGWPDFLRAAKQLVREQASVEFVVVGGGVRPPSFFDSARGRVLSGLGLASDEETQARLLAEQLGLSGRVTFLPFSSDPRDVYLALDIVTFPNRGEGLGRAVIEASACGRPIVASGSLDGAGLIVPGRTGYLVPKRSPDALAATLRLLVGNEGLRKTVGTKARTHAEDRFDPAENARRIMDLYDQVLAERARSGS
jgi:glycosyltransferase involved in cell wall biosynthesis